MSPMGTIMYWINLRSPVQSVDMSSFCHYFYLLNIVSWLTTVQILEISGVNGHLKIIWFSLVLLYFASKF